MFSRPRIEQAKNFESGKGHDNHFIGMYRIRKYGIETNFFDPEHILPNPVAKVWRRILNIFWMHLPFFPYFFKYDIVFTGGAYASLLFKAIFHLPRPKWVIYDANITGTIEKEKTLRTKLFKYAVSKADGIVALSQAEEDSLRKMFPYMGERAKFLFEGVDTKYFTPSDTEEGDYIISVGLDPSRDFGTLIEAMKGLPEIQLHIATKPERVAQYEPLPKNVTARFYTHEEMKKLYNRARINIVGLNMKEDNNDSMGTYVVIEAMASGKAIIATKTKALSSYIQDGKNGVFVPKHDVKAMQKAIRDLYNNENKRKFLGKNARDFVVKNADAEIYARELSKFLKKIHNS